MSITEIKKLAVQAAADKKFIDLFLELDTKLIVDASNDVKKINDLDDYVNNLLSNFKKKEIPKNESVFGTGAIIFTILSSIITLHFLLKLIIAIMKRKGFKDYFRGLFNKGIPWIFYATFIIYVLCILLTRFADIWNPFTLNNQYLTSDVYVKSAGISDQKMTDVEGNEYRLVKNPRSDKYDQTIYNKNGEKIGYTIGNTIYGLNGEVYQAGSGFYDNSDKVNIDNVETLLKIKIDQSVKDQIEANIKSINAKIKETNDINLNLIGLEVIKKDPKYKDERENLENRLDQKKESIIFDYKTFFLYENIEQSKKILKTLNYDWDDFLLKHSNYRNLKNALEKNNNLGYLGQFTKIITSNLTPNNITQDAKVHIDEKSFILLNIYINKILPNTEILDKIKIITGKNIVDFEDIESLDDALSKLKNWKSINWFIQQLPPKQKNLIWENSWFNKDVKSNEQFLINAILNFEKNPNLMELFIKKVSSIKTKSTFLKTLTDLTKSSWDYYTWKNKLSKTRGITITYCNELEKYIIVNVANYSAIRKVAYMTNWCIYRQFSYFNSYVYKNNRLQYILYDFNYETSNDSVIGFTIDSDYQIRACHNKADYSCSLPSKFYHPIRGRRFYKTAKAEYLGNIKNFRFNNKIIKFANWYDDNL